MKNAKSFPSLGKIASYGLAGSIVRSIYPFTEASEAALLVQLLACFGNVIGRSAHFVVEADMHFCNLFILIVGVSAKGRKGTSFGHIERLFQRAAPEWISNHVKKGLSSGEGVVLHLKDDEGGTEITEHLKDKRLFSNESEFASVLKTSSRDGSILSPVLRDCWDGKRIATLTKNSPLIASGGHVSLVGHITTIELNRYMNGVETSNGLANRFLYFLVERSKVLPDPPSIDESDLKLMAGDIQDSIKFAKSIGRMSFSLEAKNHWEQIYPKLSEGHAGIYGSITARGEAQVKRLAMVLSVFNRDTKITFDALQAALELWSYSCASVRTIFGTSTGDPLADRIVNILSGGDSGLSKSEISNKLGNNFNKGSLDSSLNQLAMMGLASSHKLKTNGRDQEIWTLNSQTNTNKHEINERSPLF